uniref:Uncharacterized protein n=1 Tax=Alexandrium andersonii TaxID=327968 RepID=A0A7S2FMK5_9DINO
MRDLTQQEAAREVADSKKGRLKGKSGTTVLDAPPQKFRGRRGKDDEAGAVSCDLSKLSTIALDGDKASPPVEDTPSPRQQRVHGFSCEEIPQVDPLPSEEPPLQTAVHGEVRLSASRDEAEAEEPDNTVLAFEQLAIGGDLGYIPSSRWATAGEAAPEATAPTSFHERERLGTSHWVAQFVDPADYMTNIPKRSLPAPDLPSAPPPPPTVPEAPQKAPWEVSDEMSLEASASFSAHDFSVPVADSLPLVIKIPPPPA